MRKLLKNGQILAAHRLLKIQMFEFAYSALLLLYFCLSSKESSLHRAAYTKSVKEWAEISCTSLQSSKSLFRKIQIFEFAYSSLSPVYFLFRFKNHHCIELYIRKVLKNGKRLVAHGYSLRRTYFAKYRFSNAHILHFRCFIPCLGYLTERNLIC